MAILGLALVGVVHAQQGKKPYNIRGIVINSVTGRPIPRVLVMVQDLTLRLALTDEGGQFEFAGIRAEPAQIRTRKTGFLDAGDPPAATSRYYFATEVSSETDSTVIRLTPASAIHGRITSTTDVPLEGVLVSLFYRGSIGGEDLQFHRSNATTDEDGLFRFDDLLAGDYFVHAVPLIGKPLVPVERSGIPLENYGPVFYPGVSDRYAATPIQLGNGQDIAIDLMLPPVRLFSVGGQITGWHTGDSGQLRLAPSAGAFFNFDSQLDPATGKFHIAQVPPGAYKIQVATADGAQAEQELIVDSDISNLKLSLSQPRKIPVFMHAGDPRAEGGTISMTLKPKDKWQQEISTPLRWGPADEAILLPTLPKGEYRVHFTSSPPLHVTSATCGTIDMLQEPLVVTGQNITQINITLGYGSSTLGGQISLQGRSVSAELVIVPIKPGGETRIEHAGSNGRFDGLRLAPGTYRVWAFDHLPKYFREPETMEAYASQAKVVTLAEDQKVEVQLEMLKGQPDE